MKYPEQKLTIEDIQDFEKELDIELTESYKEFILENNGGIPEKRHIGGYRIRKFYSLKYGGESRIEYMKNVLGDAIPKGFIPIADDGGGWLFCLSLAKDTYGQVYFCPLDREEVELVASSFEEFLGGLTEEDD